MDFCVGKRKEGKSSSSRFDSNFHLRGTHEACRIEKLSLSHFTFVHRRLCQLIFVSVIKENKHKGGRRNKEKQAAVINKFRLKHLQLLLPTKSIFMTFSFKNTTDDFHVAVITVHNVFSILFSILRDHFHHHEQQQHRKSSSSHFVIIPITVKLRN